MYKKILITGGSGWLGKGLINGLNHGLKDMEGLNFFSKTPIKALILPSEIENFKSRFPHIETVEGSLTNQANIEKFTDGEEGACIFHLAGVIHPKIRIKEFYDVNVKGSKNLINSAIKNKVKRVVVMSSNSPLGCNQDPKHKFDELSPYNPYMNYGKSKKELELFVNNIKEKIESVIIRAPWFYGPFQPDRQIEFFEMIKNGKGPIIGDGNNMRSMVYIDNLVQGLILAAHNQSIAGETFWIADREPYSMNRILNTIEELMHQEFKLKCSYKRLRLPYFVSEIAYYLDMLIQKIGLYNQKIHVLSEMNKNIVCNIDKAINKLSYNPKIDLKEGMRRSLNDFYGDNS